MVDIVIKPTQDRDEYVIWSTMFGKPIACGDRGETLGYLRERHPDGGRPEERLLRADRLGSSAYDLWQFGYWCCTEFIVEQRGYLPREHLATAYRLMREHRDPEIWDLMTPLDEDTEVRRD